MSTHEVVHDRVFHAQRIKSLVHLSDAVSSHPILHQNEYSSILFTNLSVARILGKYTSQDNCRDYHFIYSSNDICQCKLASPTLLRSAYWGGGGGTTEPPNFKLVDIWRWLQLDLLGVLLLLLATLEGLEIY